MKIAATLLACVIALPALADGPGPGHRKQQWPSDVNWPYEVYWHKQGGANHGHVRVPRRHHVERPRHHSRTSHRHHHPRREPEVAGWLRTEPAYPTHRCHPPIRTVGDQDVSDDGAKAAAKKAWVQEARWRYGEKSMSLDIAQGLQMACARSSIGTVLGQNFVRCEIQAMPCEAAMEFIVK